MGNRYIHNQIDEDDLISSIQAAIISGDKNPMESMLKAVRGYNLANASSQMLDGLENLIWSRHRFPNSSHVINDMQRNGCVDTELYYKFCDIEVNRSISRKDSL